MKSDQFHDWIEAIVSLCQPDAVHLCDGSFDESQELLDDLARKGTCMPLNPILRPDSYWFRSDPSDVARVEDRTFICSATPEAAGPTNNWRDPVEMKAELQHLFKGCMRGRTLYIIPFSMGPLKSPFARLGIQITDSPYAVCNMRLMTHVGFDVWEQLATQDFVPCVHSVGMPLEEGIADVPWPCNAAKKVIVHFPETREIWSFGSGYGGNALLGKKCLALRIASVMGHEEGWLAEHMLILGITNPAGEKKYIAAAFPSACGKTNLAMLQPTLPGWKIETVGDDIAWMHIGADGRLYAVNPEAGFFGVAPGTSMESNPNAMMTLTRNAIFTNVALTEEGDVWWEGMTQQPPKRAINWLRHAWTPESKEKAAHPNSRFTVSAAQCPIIDPAWQDPQGVPISAILFGGRRAHVTPLVCEAFNWQHGVFLGASISSETTAANVGQVGKLRHDPFAMLPFCGYNMGDYFAHWLSFAQRTDESLLPHCYAVNWFRKGANGEYLWPGFGENSRVLKWIFERTSDKGAAVETPIGYLPAPGALDVEGMELNPGAIEELLRVDARQWSGELEELRQYFLQFGSQLPQALTDELEQLNRRLD